MARLDNLRRSPDEFADRARAQLGRLDLREMSDIGHEMQPDMSR